MQEQGLAWSLETFLNRGTDTERGHEEKDSSMVSIRDLEDLN